MKKLELRMMLEDLSTHEVKRLMHLGADRSIRCMAYGIWLKRYNKRK